MTGTFRIGEVVRVIEGRKGPLTPGQVADQAGITTKQMGRILGEQVTKPHDDTLLALDETLGLPYGTLKQVGEGRQTADEAIFYGTGPNLEHRVATVEDELAEVRRLLSDVLARLGGR